MQKEKYDTLEGRLYSHTLMLLDYDLDGLVFDAGKASTLQPILANAFGEEICALTPEAFEEVKKGFIALWQEYRKRLDEKIEKLIQKQGALMESYVKDAKDEQEEVDKLTNWIEERFTLENVCKYVGKKSDE